MDVKEFLQKKIDEIKTPLYHSISLKNFELALEKNKLEARTTQRYWTDGIRRKDKDPLYETSKWMKGWSMTRDFDFAARWNDIVLVFEKEDLNRNLQIEPYSWNFSIASIPNTDHKKEREEFVVALKTNKSTNEYKKITDRENALNRRRYQKTKDEKYLDNVINYIEKMKSPEGKGIELSKIKGIYISERVKDKEVISNITQLSQFKGFFNDTEVKQRYANTIDMVDKFKRKNKI